MDRDSLLNYGKNEEFFGTVKEAKMRIQAFIEQRLYENNPTGCIFNLKNNFGWKDKTETEHSTPEGKPFQLETKNLTDTEINARIAELTLKTAPSKDGG